jgi:hypothetical protein
MMRFLKSGRVLLLGGALLAAGAVAFSGLGVVAQQAPAEPEAVGGPATLRRLTESQYRATIADIFGTDISITGRFERGLRVDRLIAVGTSESGLSPFSFEQYDNMARGIAAQVVGEEHRQALLPCQPRSETSFDRSCATRVVETYGSRLFRRPLTSEEVTNYVTIARGGEQRLNNFYSGVELALAAMMSAPEFLFRVERVGDDPTQLDAYSRAVRLSYFLTDSTPDEELLRAARAGELNTQEGIAAQADRLIASPKFEQGVRAFFWDMMRFDAFADLAKDPVIYPVFNSRLAADAQEQTMRTVVDQLVTRRGDYRDLFTTRDTFLTRSLGLVYRMPVATRNGFQASEYPDTSARAGIVTDVAFLALHSHPGRSSSTLRGKAIREVFLCQEIPPPPPAVDFSVVQDATNTAMPTARERLSAHQTQPQCASCHRLMDPLGLALENFDGVGSFREQENGATIDASGSLDGRAFNDAAGLGQALHDSALTSRCLVNNMYRYAVGRNTAREERPWMDYLNQSFATNGYRVPDLMRAIAVSRTFYTVAPAAAEAAPATQGTN